jgi:HlyD family secretion protein
MASATESEAPADTEVGLDPISKKLRSLQLKADERRGGGGPRWGRLVMMLFLAGSAVAGYFGYEEYKKKQAQQVIEVEAITFGERAGGGILLEPSGFIVPQTKVQIAPQTAGKIIELPIQEGMKVVKDQILCRIEDDTYRAELLRAEAALALAQSQLLKLTNGVEKEEIEQALALLRSSEVSLQDATDQYDRIKRLFDTGSASQQDLQKLEAGKNTALQQKIANEAKVRLLERGARAEDVAVAEAQVAQAQASVQLAKITVNNAVIKAPCDGTILEKNAQVGELILPQTVITSLCVLADLNAMEADVAIQEREVAKVSIGHPCRVIPDAYPDVLYEAELVRMQPLVNRTRGVVAMRVKILKPDDRLLTDMNCRVQFLKREDQSEQQSKTVPIRAVETKEGVSRLFVLDNQVARQRTVRLGQKLGDEVEILEGVKTGEMVLLPGNTPLLDGQSIKPRLLDEKQGAEQSGAAP